MSADRKRLLLFLAGVLLALVGLYLLAKRQNPAAVTAPAASAPSTAASMPTANYEVTLDSYNGPGYTPPAVAASPTAPPMPPAQLPLALLGTGSAFPVQDNLAIVPQFPWG